MPIFLILFALLLAGCNPFGPSSIDPTFGINTDSEADPASEAISVSVTTAPADGSLVRTSNCTPVELEVPTPASAELKLDISLALYDGTEVEGLFADSACGSGADSHQEITIVAGQSTATAYVQVDSPGSYRVSAAATIATDAYEAGYADFNADTFSVQIVSSEAAYYFEQCFAVTLGFSPSVLGVTHTARVELTALHSTFYESLSDCGSESDSVTSTTSSTIWVRIATPGISETLSPSAAGYLTVATSITGITGPRPQLELAAPTHSRTGVCNEVVLSVSAAPSVATSIDITVAGTTAVIYSDACTTTAPGNQVVLEAGDSVTSFYVKNEDEEVVRLTASRGAADYCPSDTVEIEFYDPELSWTGLAASMPAYVCTEATVSVYDPGVSESLSLSLNKTNIEVYSTLNNCRSGSSPPTLSAIALSARDGGAGSSHTVYVKGLSAAAATLTTNAGFAAVTHNITFYNLLNTLSLSSSRITDVQRLDLGAVVSYYIVGDFSTAAAGMPNGLRRIDLTGANLSPHIDLRRTNSVINTVTAADITSTAIVVGGTKSDATAMAAIYTDTSYWEDSIGAGISLARVNAVGTVGYWAFAPGFTGARGTWGTAAAALGLSDWETNLLLSNGKQIVVEDSTEAAAVLKSSGERESTAGVFSSMIRLSDGKYLAALYDEVDQTFSIGLSDDLTNAPIDLATPSPDGMGGKVKLMYQVDSDHVLLVVESEDTSFYRWTRSGSSHSVAQFDAELGLGTDTEIYAIESGPGYSECGIVLAGKNFYKSLTLGIKFTRDLLCADSDDLQVYQGHRDTAP